MAWFLYCSRVVAVATEFVSRVRPQRELEAPVDGLTIYNINLINIYNTREDGSIIIK